MLKHDDNKHRAKVPGGRAKMNKSGLGEVMDIVQFGFVVRDKIQAECPIPANTLNNKFVQPLLGGT